VNRLRWRELYTEAELYKAAVRVYTKPLFQWRKALGASWDDHTFYDFARHGLRNLEAIHRKLADGRFAFRAAAARTLSFNGKRRTLYILPWEEKVVDLLLYRLLTARFRGVFSPASYAYRERSHGVDLCQTRIGRLMRTMSKPLFVFKRDIANYFDSIDHEILLGQLSAHIERDDYLWELVGQRVRFLWRPDPSASPGAEHAGNAEPLARQATRGVPFGTPVACFFANLHLTELDHALSGLDRLHYFRYADDLLGISAMPAVIERAAQLCDRHLAALRLSVKSSHAAFYAVAESRVQHPPFAWVTRFKHLGLEFRADGRTGLSRDKARKLRNIFRYAFRRKSGRLARIRDPRKRAQLVATVARETLSEGLRNVAILDYYLKHVRDERQLREIDRWLAEETLAIAFENGHRKGNFRRISFRQLRALGLPSLLHRSRQLRHGQIESSFLRWIQHQQAKGTRAGRRQAAHAVFSPDRKAVVANTSWERGTTC
jgi:hypothetical protein